MAATGIPYPERRERLGRSVQRPLARVSHLERSGGVWRTHVDEATSRPKTWRGQRSDRRRAVALSSWPVGVYYPRLDMWTVLYHLSQHIWIPSMKAVPLDCLLIVSSFSSETFTLKKKWMNEFTSPCFERRPNGGMGVLLVLSKSDFVKAQLELTVHLQSS
jgi:hypothetical protein